VLAVIPAQRNVDDAMSEVRAVPATQGGTHDGPRLGFLDVLRGVAALAVAAFHFGNQPPVGTAAFHYFSSTIIELGQFGVELFFMVSGFIIPASLQRSTVPEFWVNRIFRLFPVYWLLSAIVVVLYYLHHIDIPAYEFKYKAFLALGNITLLSHFLGASALIGSGWTLPFEICFYLSTTVLFVTRLRGRDGTASLAAMGLAIAGGILSVLAFDRVFPMFAVTPRSLGVAGHAGAALRVFLTGIVVGLVAAALARTRANAVYAGVVAGSVTVLLLNRPWPLHQAAVYVTLMFTGTVIYRVAAGHLSPVAGWLTVAFVGLAASLAFYIHTDPLTTAIGESRGLPDETWWTRSVAMLAAMLVFLALFALRDRVRWPRWLQWLGRISYSVYLVHWIVMYSVPGLPEGTPARGLLTLLVWLAVTMGVSTLTYYFVERPAIKVGRRAARWARTKVRWVTLDGERVTKVKTPSATPAAVLVGDERPGA
jgi:peptidoglycan/LPS O-acetylase OafA/YrhL